MHSLSALPGSSTNIDHLARSALNKHAILSITDTRGNIVYVNEKFTEISGYSADELVGQNHRILKSGLHDKEFYYGLWQAIKSGRHWHGEVCNKKKDGKFYWVAATIMPYPEHAPEYYVSIRTEITHVKVMEDRLRRSQIFSNIGTWDWNIRTGELFWSERIAPLFGYEPGAVETTYESFLKAVHPEDRQAVIDAVNNCVEKGLEYNIEHRCVWPDGSVRWLHERGDVVRDVNGTPLFMLGVVQDIHDRKLYEEALRLEKNRLLEAEQRASLGHWKANLITGELYWSPVIYEIFGEDPNTFVPTTAKFIAAVHPDDVEKVRQSERKALETGVHDVIHRIIRPDGSIRTVHERANFSTDQNQRVELLIGTVQDITEVIALQEQLNVYRKIIESTSQGVVLTDAEGKILYLNAEAKKILESSDKSTLNRHFSEFIENSVQGKDALLDVLKAIEAGTGLKSLIPVTSLGGKSITIQSNLGLIKDPEGNIQYLFNIFEDYALELKRIDELKTAKQAAEASNLAKNQFLSRMSHEIRTPMNAILGFAQLLSSNEKLEASDKENVYQIMKAGQHLLDLVNEVLDLSRIETGNIEMNIEPLLLNELLLDCLTLLQPIAEKRKINIDFVPQHTTAVLADKLRLKQVFFNLLSNAIKYNIDGGSIQILVTATKESYIRIAFKDTGIGIPEKKISELFKPFSRLGAEDSQIEGAGIGLVISQKLIKLMHGRIFLENTSDQGSTFCLEIPMTVLFANSARKLILPQNNLVLQNYGYSDQKTILYVEDNEVNALLMRKIFLQKKEIELIICETGAEAERICANQKVDLVLLDLNLEDETGYDVLARLRSLPGYESVNIIAVSADAMPNELKKSSEAGFSDYVTKPLNIPVLLRLVYDHLFPSLAAE